jgi:hypothetical protein
MVYCGERENEELLHAAQNAIPCGLNTKIQIDIKVGNKNETLFGPNWPQIHLSLPHACSSSPSIAYLVQTSISLSGMVKAGRKQFKDLWHQHKSPNLR